MYKSVVAVACVVALSIVGQAGAVESAIPSNTLQAMGLGSAEVVADSTSGEVRGMGYLPISIAAGGSFAGVISEHGAAAGSINVYGAGGKFAASGANYSEAGIDIVKSHSVDIGGVVKTVVKSKSIRVYAGGYSSAMSF